jgi:hypothetical protein
VTARNDDASVATYARLVAAAVMSPNSRQRALEQEDLDEDRAARLKAHVEGMLAGRDGSHWRERFSVCYKAALRGERAPEPPAHTSTPPPSATMVFEAVSESATDDVVAGECTLPLSRPHRAAVRPDTPFAAAVDDALTFEQFAAYQAEMTLQPDRSPAIFERYGLADARKRRAIHKTWAERLRDPALLARWEAAVDRLVAAARAKRDP